MQVEIDAQVVTEAVQSVAQKALTEAINNWEIAKGAREAVAKSIEDIGLVKMISDALSEQVRASAEALVARAASAAVPAIEAAVTAMVREQAVGVLYALRAGGGYVERNQEAAIKQEIRASLA